jgi:translation initiation factor eIF-2B subunit gamma
MVGEGTRLGDKSMIKRSIIGKNCVIGDKSKVVNSVLFDSVIIGDNVTINGSIICGNCRLQKCEIQNSVVEDALEIHADAAGKIVKIQNEIYSTWED